MEIVTVRTSFFLIFQQAAIADADAKDTIFSAVTYQIVAA